MFFFSFGIFVELNSLEYWFMLRGKVFIRNVLYYDNCLGINLKLVKVMSELDLCCKWIEVGIWIF